MFWLYVGIVVVLLLGIGVRLNSAKKRELRAAPSGSTRVESIKASYVNNTVSMYTAAGWQVVDQTTAKSLGSSSRVTITFKKSSYV